MLVPEALPEIADVMLAVVAVGDVRLAPERIAEELAYRFSKFSVATDQDAVPTLPWAASTPIATPRALTLIGSDAGVPVFVFVFVGVTLIRFEIDHTPQADL